MASKLPGSSYLRAVDSQQSVGICDKVPLVPHSLGRTTLNHVHYSLWEVPHSSEPWSPTMETYALIIPRGLFSCVQGPSLLAVLLDSLPK